jgi:hypothetical protein
LFKVFQRKTYLSVGTERDFVFVRKLVSLPVPKYLSVPTDRLGYQVSFLTFSSFFILFHPFSSKKAEKSRKRQEQVSFPLESLKPVVPSKKAKLFLFQMVFLLGKPSFKKCFTKKGSLFLKGQQPSFS